MISHRKRLLGLMLSVGSALTLYAVNEPIIVEAEAGSPIDPSIFAVQTANVGGTNVTFVRVNGDFVAGQTTSPYTSSRVISYTVTFPQAGTYDLYIRFRVGSNPGNDDSFYYGASFGPKVVSAPNDWIMANQLSGVGYSNNQQIVLGAGTGSAFKWLKLSAFNGGEAPVQFVVPEGELTQTFQIGSRENGLDIDKFAFGVPGVYYTVANLNAGQAGSTTPPPPPYTPPADQKPLAFGKAKWLGSAHSTAQNPHFAKYWNQVVPENGGKWGSVEGTRDVMNWGDADAAYNMARSNGFPFRYHVLFWGAQQPAWIRTLPPAEQLEEIEEWIAAVAARYPDIDYLEVVNEPLHDPPDASWPGNSGTQDFGGYKQALGGDNGTDGTGWDWILNAFRLARLYFPHTKLVLNDYSITNTNSSTTTYLQIINILKAEGLIDAIGIQGHAFSTTGSMTTHVANLDRLAATGLPIHVTEMDIDGPTDQVQLEQYMRIFPTFWTHPGVAGITLWGWRPGHWRTTQGAYLVNDDGGERPALVWLKHYVGNAAPVVTAGQSFVLGAGSNNVVGTAAATDANAGNPNAYHVLQNWSIVGGDGAALFAINPATGVINIPNPLALDFTRTQYTLAVTVSDGVDTSAVQNITVTIPTQVRLTYKGRVVTIYKLSVPAMLRSGATIGGL